MYLGERLVAEMGARSQGVWWVGQVGSTALLVLFPLLELLHHLVRPSYHSSLEVGRLPCCMNASLQANRLSKCDRLPCCRSSALAPPCAGAGQRQAQDNAMPSTVLSGGGSMSDPNPVCLSPGRIAQQYHGACFCFGVCEAAPAMTM